MESARRTVLAHLGRYTDGVLPLLRTTLPDVEFVAKGEAGSDAAEALVAMIDDREGAPGLAGALTPAVRWVHVLGTGVDGFPFAALGDRTLTCSRGAAAIAISEFVMAAMLAFAKQLPEVWISERPEGRRLAALDTLKGKTLGIIGLRAIGSELARRALAFEMAVVAVRRRPAPSPVEGVGIAGSLDELLERSDHIVVAAPATGATHHLLDAKAFTAVRRGVHLINIARGDLIDQEALMEALDDGRIARATLDVTSPEPLPSGHPLYRHPRVRISPHISWSSPDTFRITLKMFADNLRRYEAGEPLEGVVNPAEGY